VQRFLEFVENKSEGLVAIVFEFDVSTRRHPQRTAVNAQPTKA
jgi:hypothetical protein